MDSEIRNSLFTLLREVNDAEVMKDSQLRDCIDELDEQMLTTRREPAALQAAGPDAERVERVREYLDNYLDDCQDTTIDDDEMTILAEKNATEIVAFVTAARDAEIRQMLLSDEAIEAMNEVWKYPDANMDGTHRMQMQAALNHIGLAEQEDA